LSRNGDAYARALPIEQPTYSAQKTISETPPAEQRPRQANLRKSKQWRIAMNALKILIATALISTATLSAASAAWSFADQEPATFASMYPNRDVLNGGALTPAGRMGLERAGGAAPVFGLGEVHTSHRHG
jgi:hypothetical protein